MAKNTTLFVGLCAAACAAAALVFFIWPKPQPAGLTLNPTRVISAGGIALHVAIADTEASRERGLSGVTALKPDEGMLFVFPEDGSYSFWMKDMLFSIDMLWISAQGRVVFIVPSATPESYPQAFTPDTPARYVLEVPAGFAAAHDIETGSEIAL